jgi:hypothetical protein
MASESDGEQQLQAAAEQVMSGAPWQSASADSTTESLTESLVEALKDATESVSDLTAVQQSQTEGTARSLKGSTAESAAGILQGIAEGSTSGIAERSTSGIAEGAEGIAQSMTGGSAAEGVLQLLTGVGGGQNDGGMALSTAGGMADSLLSGGSLLSPIISGIMSLFGSDSSSTPPPLIPFTMPPALDVDATGGQTTGGQLAGSDYGADGLSRAQTISNTMSSATLPTTSPSASQATSSANSHTTSQANSRTTSQATSNVTVQVNAMDSRSFLDRSNDIAAAVRQAILSSHSINDVLSEL